MILKIEDFFYKKVEFKICCTIFPRHFVQLETLRLSIKTLAFLEFLLFNSDAQGCTKKWFSKFKI